MKLEYIAIDEQVADVLAKPFPWMKFAYFNEYLGIVENSSLVEREH